MRFTRLVIEADQNTVSLGLHPRLTVVAGMDERVRDGLADELIGGLGPTRAGIHLELVDDAGRHLTVFRPTASPHRVIEVSGGRDVSDEFRAEDGRIDLLDHHGLDVRRAWEVLHLDRSTLEANTQRDVIVNRLAEIDLTQLWSAAARVRITDEELQNLNHGIELGAEDADLVARIEQRHQSLESAVDGLRRLRRRTALVAVVTLAAAVPVTLVRPALALPLLAIGVAAMLAAFLYRARVEAARRAERTALADVGVESYLGYEAQRVDGLFPGTEARRRLAAAGEDHRNAAMRWTGLAGDVSVEWALEHHDEIEATARLRGELRSLTQLSSTAPDLDEEAADIANAIEARLDRLRHVGRGGESFPLILDDPFVAVVSSTKLSLLELLARSAGSPQVILLTEDEDVASWARLETLTGEVALVEPHTEPRHAHRANHLAV